MLTDTEKVGCRELLAFLQDDDLFTLVDTVTQKRVAVTSRDGPRQKNQKIFLKFVGEAIDVIINFTVSASEFLNRKKIKREHLYQYLIKQQQIFPSTADKQFLIRRLKQFWNPDRNLEDDEKAQAQTQNRNSDQRLPNKLSMSSESQQSNEGLELAKQFIPWYFENLNMCHPNLTADNSQSQWGPQHFWKDAQLIVEFKQGDEDTQEHISGSDGVSERLLSLVFLDQILFNPNVSTNGIKGQLEPHGVAMVSAAGTIHKNETPVGFFEQAFWLVRDPLLQNNWKIKNTKLKLGKNANQSMKALPGNSSSNTLVAART